MSESDAATLVEEPLVRVISETNTDEPTTTQVLMSPPEPSPLLHSEDLMDGSQRPPELPDALLRLQNSGHHLQVVLRAMERTWEPRSGQKGIVRVL